MKLIPTMIKNFAGKEFKPNTVFFEYSGDLYQVLRVTGKSIKYQPQGSLGVATLQDQSAYDLVEVTTRNSIFGRRVVFKIH